MTDQGRCCLLNFADRDVMLPLLTGSNALIGPAKSWKWNESSECERPGLRSHEDGSKAKGARDA